MTPGISCLCLTFARPPRLLEEAVQSFLQQDYAGKKELLVLNDFSGQTIRFDHAEVSIVNVPERYPSVGDKRNAAVAMAKYDLLAVWDDDDIYLPHRLSFSLTHYDSGRRFFKPSRAFMLNDGVLTGPEINRFHSSSLWHRSLFEEAGGYPSMGSGEDAEIEARFRQTIGKRPDYDGIRAEEVFYLYRWRGTQSYHLSQFGRDGPDGTGNEKVWAYVETQLARGEIPCGEIALDPHWRTDYCQLVRDYCARLAG